MNLEKIFEKVEKKLAFDDVALAIQKCDMEAGDLAIKCLSAKIANSKNPKYKSAAYDVDSIKKDILNLFNVKGVKTLASGTAGAVLGGALGNLSSSRGDSESDDEYKRRKRDSTVTGALAGGAIGASLPSILKSMGSVSGMQGSTNGGENGNSGSSVSLINPTTISVGAGAAAGHTIDRLKSIADKSLLPKNPTPLQHNVAVGNHSYIKDLPQAIKNSRVAQKINQLPLLKNILLGVTKRKFLLPAAGAVAVPAALDHYFNKPFFDQPVFE
jgi:hypothetical protein